MDYGYICVSIKLTSPHWLCTHALDMFSMQLLCLFHQKYTNYEILQNHLIPAVTIFITSMQIKSKMRKLEKLLNCPKLHLEFISIYIPMQLDSFYQYTVASKIYNSWRTTQKLLLQVVVLTVVFYIFAFIAVQ